MRERPAALARGVLLFFTAAALMLVLFYPRPQLPFAAFPGEKVQRLARYETGNIGGVYLASSDEQRRLVQIVNAQGFGGVMQFQVDIDVKRQSIRQVLVREQQESEDYGTYVTEDWFLSRFRDKHAGTPLRLVKMAAHSAEEVVAITGATVTSRGALAAVNECMSNWRKIIEEDGVK